MLVLLIRVTPAISPFTSEESIPSPSYVTQLNITTVTSDCTDSVEFQTLLKDDTLCDVPSMLIRDRLDVNSFFLQCGQWTLRLTTDVTSPSGDKITQVVQSVGPHSLFFSQLPGSTGSLLIPDNPFVGKFYVADREGKLPMRSFIPQGYRPTGLGDTLVEYMAVIPQLAESSSAAVYYIEIIFPSEANSFLRRMRINYLSLNDSVVESLPLQNMSLNNTGMSALHVLPNSHLLLIVCDTIVVEFNMLTDEMRTVFNISDPSISPESTSILYLGDDTFKYGLVSSAFSLRVGYCLTPPDLVDGQNKTSCSTQQYPVPPFSTWDAPCIEDYPDQRLRTHARMGNGLRLLLHVSCL